MISTPETETKTTDRAPLTVGSKSGSKSINKTLQWFIWSALIVIVCSLGIAFVYQHWRQAVVQRGHPILESFNTVPSFQFTDQNGDKFDKSTKLDGKIWVANFFFTSCPGPCLKMNGQVQELQEALKEKSDVRIVSFSINPEFDTPQVLQNYANRFKATPDRWYFLTGNRTKIYDLAKKTFMLGITDSKTGEEKLADGEFIHSTKLALVDTHGVVRGYYDSNNPEIIPKILTDIGNIMREKQ